MIADRSNPSAMARRALLGTDAHVATSTVFDALDWHTAGLCPPGAPHTAYQVLNHMIYWQEWVLAWLDGKSPATPRHAAAGWPGEAAPPTRAAWTRAVRRFRGGLAGLARRCKPRALPRRGGKTPLEMLATIAAHNSYHAGQVVQLRQLTGHWPPAAGGLTW